jgi:diguanylate cyclase
MHSLRRQLAEDFFGPTRNSWGIFALLVMLALAVTAVVYATGGTKYVYVQMMYLPIVLSGLLFPWRVGMGFAVFAGLLMGPFMPLEVETQTFQPTQAWLLDAP